MTPRGRLPRAACQVTSPRRQAWTTAWTRRETSPYQPDDDRQYAGFVRETIAYNGSQEVSGTTNTPWS